MEKSQEINIRKAFADKNPKLAKMLPGFVFRFIEKIIHQEEMNGFIREHVDYKGIDYLNEVIKFFKVRVEIEGRENLPANGRNFFVSNHPLGGLDGLIIIQALHHHYGKSQALVNDLLMNFVNLRPFFLPLNKHGSNSREVALLLDDVYKSDMPIMSFPAGMVSRMQKDGIREVEWHKNFIIKSVQHQRDVVPIYFVGQNSSRFYNTAKYRTMLGINANLEMFLLPSEMFRQRNKTVVVRIGKPIPWQTFDKSKSPSQWAEEVKNMVYSMASKPIDKRMLQK